MTAMIVSNAGSSWCNGTYTENGTYGGKPLYGTVISGIAWYDSSRWVIINEESVFYDSHEDTATPDLAINWEIVNFGTLPIPTVMAEGQSSPPTKKFLFKKM